MSVLLAAILLAAQSSPPAQAAVPPAQKAKPKQICEMMEVTGSRSRKRVCRDANGKLDLGPGVSDLGERGTNQRQTLMSNQPGGGGGSN